MAQEKSGENTDHLERKKSEIVNYLLKEEKEIKRKFGEPAFAHLINITNRSFGFIKYFNSLKDKKKREKTRDIFRKTTALVKRFILEEDFKEKDNIGREDLKKHFLNELEVYRSKGGKRLKNDDERREFRAFENLNKIVNSFFCLRSFCEKDKKENYLESVIIELIKDIRSPFMKRRVKNK